MNQSQEVINELSAMRKPKFREGDRVRFSGGSIHGRPTGVIRRLFKNGKASVVAKVRGVEKVFHPDFDDMSLVESHMIECPHCDGEGEVDGETCPECNGEGEIEANGNGDDDEE